MLEKVAQEVAVLRPSRRYKQVMVPVNLGLQRFELLLAPIEVAEPVVAPQLVLTPRALPMKARREYSLAVVRRVHLVGRL